MGGPADCGPAKPCPPLPLPEKGRQDLYGAKNR